MNNAKRHGKIPDRWLLYAVCHSGLALPLLLTLTDLELSRALTDKSRYAFKLVPMIKSLQDLRDENYVAMHHCLSGLAKI